MAAVIDFAAVLAPVTSRQQLTRRAQSDPKCPKMLNFVSPLIKRRAPKPTSFALSSAGLGRTPMGWEIMDAPEPTRRQQWQAAIGLLSPLCVFAALWAILAIANI
jgi:hypothetical protein